MSNDKKDLGDLIHRALTYGIKLRKMSRTEEQQWLLSLSDYINKGGMFVSVYKENKITIENKYLDPIVMVRIRKGTLEFLPLSESSFFDSFMSVLGYISNKKKEEELMREFKVFVDEIDKDLLKGDEDTEEALPQETEDDFDWI